MDVIFNPIYPLRASTKHKKVDDGIPQSGNVTAQTANGCTQMWASGIYPGTQGGPFTTATPSSNTSCFDNGGSNGATQHYSTEVNNGAGANCALSFKMQAGD
jgi:hypothetical protein